MEMIFLNPITYVALILIVLKYRRQVELERKLFGVRIHNMGEEVFRSLGFSLLAGMIASIMILSLGITLQFGDLWIVWFIALILFIVNVQFLCFAYAAGITSLLSLISSLWPQGGTISYLSWIWEPLLQVDIPSLIALVAILHITEAIIVRFNSIANATPIFLRGKRGKLIGAYHLQSFWFIPLVILVPGNGEFIMEMPSWWPLISGTAAGLVMTTVPAILGFSALAVSRPPRQTANDASWGLGLYSLLLLGLAWLSIHLEIVQWFAALFAIVIHEVLTAFAHWRERNNQPLYSSDERGVMILSVLPKSAAEEMELKPGEIVAKVNGIPIKTKRDMYEAIQKQSGSFCKLEVINLEGHIKFAKRALYDGENHQLGIIVAPDEDTDFYLHSEKVNIFEFVMNTFTSKTKTKTKTRRISKEKQIDQSIS